MHQAADIARAYHFNKRESAEAAAKEHDGDVISHEGGFVIYLGFGTY